jgi:integrase
MTLYKRGNIWWAYVQIDGERHAKSTGTANRRHAQSIGEAFEDELNLKRHQMPKLNPEMTVDELAALFIGEGLAKEYALGRLKYVLPFFGSMKLAEIDKAAVRRYRQARHSASNIKVATTNRDMSVLRRVLYFGVEEGYISTNPIARLQMERERRTKRPVLSVREELILLVAAADHLFKIIICALDTGMRRGEILAQLWEDIDFDNRILYVSHSKTPEGEMREIPLTRRLYDLLFPIKQEKGFVFTFRDEPLTEIKRAWKAARRRAELRHFRFHDLRHTANTRMTLAGVMQEVRRELMGHTLGKSRDVNDRYTNIQLPEKRDAIRKLEAWHDTQVAELAQTEFAPAEPQEPKPAAQP